MGIDNIFKHDGFGIAATGMIIVFVALAFVSLFIFLLPKVLSAFEYVVPAAPEPQAATKVPSRNDEEIAAAIGFALSHHDAHNAPAT